MHRYLDQLRQSCQAQPRRWAWAATGVAVCLGLGLATAVWLGSTWESYRLEGTLLTLDLPGPPTPIRADADGEAAALYDLKLEDLAVIASGGNLSADQKQDPSFLINQALSFIRQAQGVTDLRYEVGRETINGQPCIMVAGTFRRHEIPARLTGAFFFKAEQHAHVICFWSDPDGAKKAARIVQSIRLES